MHLGAFAHFRRNVWSPVKHHSYPEIDYVSNTGVLCEHTMVIFRFGAECIFIYLNEVNPF